MSATNPQYGRSFPQLFTDVVNQVTGLFRTEMQLARTEMSEKVGQAVGAMVMVMVGAVLIIPALVVLLQALVAALVDSGIAPPWAALMVGGGALIIGLVLALVGINRLKAENLAPSRTVEQLQRDSAVAKEQLR